MRTTLIKDFLCSLLALSAVLVLPGLSRAQNQVMGRLQFVAHTDADKKSGVWIDGQYVGYVDELKGDKEIFLLPGEHEVSVRQAGYTDFTQKLTVEPGKEITVDVPCRRILARSTPR